jgi:ABC-type phosphate/phosphonate transport system substrate-binding protein
MKTTDSETKIADSQLFRIRRTVIVITFILLLAFANRFAFGADQATFDLNLPPSLLGEGSSTIYREFQDLRAIFKNEMDLDLTVKLTDSWGAVISRLETGKTDFAWLPPYYYIRARETNPKSQIKPLVIYQSKGSTVSPVCVYVKAGNDMNKLDDLIATKISLPDESLWAVLNHIFMQDKEISAQHIILSDFFVKFRILPRESSALALRYGAADAIVIEPLYMEYLKPKSNEKVNIAKLACSEPLSNTLLVYRKNMDPLLKETLELILTSMHSEPAFAGFRPFFKATSGQWITATDKDLVPWKIIYRESVKNGWDKKYKTLLKDR